MPHTIVRTQQNSKVKWLGCGSHSNCGIIMSKIRHMKGSGRQHDTVILNFVGKYRQRATKLIKTVGFYAACLVLHESALIFENEKSRIGLLCIFENFSTLGRVHYEVQHAMAKRPCARCEGLWKRRVDL